MADKINGWTDISFIGTMLADSSNHIANIKTPYETVPLYERPAPFHEFFTRIGDRWFSISMISSVSQLASEVALIQRIEHQ